MKNNKRILNIGNGNDFSYGTDFIDMYPSSKRVKKCNVNNDRFPYKDNTFDEVYAKNIFEHLLNFDNFLSESYRVLKHDGHITILTDNAGFWGIFGNVHHGNYEKNSIGGSNDKHYELFTPTHLKNFLETYKFMNIKVIYKNSTEFKVDALGYLNKRLCPHIMATGCKV